VNAGHYFDAAMSAGGGFGKVAPFLAMGNAVRQLIAGKPEAAAMSFGRVAAVSVFGPSVLIVEGVVILIKSESARRDTQPPAPVEDRSIAPVEPWTGWGLPAPVEDSSIAPDAPPDEVQVAEIAAIENDTREIDQETAVLTQAADIVEGFRFPGQFIGEGEEVPVNVLAVDSATSETGEAGYTPIAAMSLDNEILYDQAYLPWIGGVIQAVAAGISNSDTTGFPPGFNGTFDTAAWQPTGAAEVYEVSPLVTKNVVDFLRNNPEYNRADLVCLPHPSGEKVCGYFDLPVIASLPITKISPDAFTPDAGGADDPYAPPGGPDAPYAPTGGPGAAYAPPCGWGARCAETGAPGAPYPILATGFDVPRRDLPLMPAGTIVPGASFEFAEDKKPFPWWLLITIVTLGN